MLVEEDTTWDSETSHTSEVVSYVAIQGNGTLTAVRRQTIIQRTTYRLAGQTIAVKVSGSPADDGLYYLHSDHLGSASVLSNASGTAVPGSEARCCGAVFDSGRLLLGRGVLARAGLPDRAPTACQSPACLPAPSVCFHPA